MRRRLVAVITAGLLSVLLAGCTTPYGEPNHTGTGALIGGASGAGLGAILARRNPAAGMLFGGALGAVTGGLIGNSMDQQARTELYGVAPPPPAPAPHYIWVNGQWIWDGFRWVWSPAHWAAVP